MNTPRNTPSPRPPLCAFLLVLLLATLPGILAAGGLDFPIPANREAVFRRNASLSPGLNLNKQLSGTAGWATAQDLVNIRNAGFNSVRIPAYFAGHAPAATTPPPTSTPRYPVSSAYWARVDQTIAWARAAGLVVVLDLHVYGPGLEDNHPGDPGVKEKDRLRLIDLWTQIANRYNSQYGNDHFFFELLNEPRGNLTDPEWDALFPRVVAAIRATGGNNATRPLVIGSVNWQDYSAIPWLNFSPPAIAADDNLIASFHYYHPMDFTHQGADWTTPIRPVGVPLTGANVRAALGHFEQVLDWMRTSRRPVYLGEFGAIHHADPVSRTLFADAIAEAAASRGISHAWWCAREDSFGIYANAGAVWDRAILGPLLALPAKWNPAASGWTAFTPGGVAEYRLRNVWTDGRLALASASSGALAVTNPASYALSQTWGLDRILSNAGLSGLSDPQANERLRWFSLVNMASPNPASPLALNVSGSSVPADVNIIAHNPASNRQRWSAEWIAGQTHRLREQQAGNYLNATSTTAGAPVRTGVYNASWTSMQWKLEPVWR